MCQSRALPRLGGAAYRSPQHSPAPFLLPWPAGLGDAKTPHACTWGVQ